MANKDITSYRGMLEFMNEGDDILTVNKEIDPIYQVAGISKALDNGPALLFQNVKGFPNRRILSGLFSRGERVSKIFDVAETKDLKFKGLEALKNPIPPRIVDGGPCQEVVITQDIDVLGSIPVIKYTETDPGRILAGGNILISGPDIGNCISFKRIHFRGKDWSSMVFNPGSHFEHWVLERKKEKGKLPLTINICTPPAVQVVASAGGIPSAIPVGSDELAIAGGLQGVPVEICKAKTVDAYAIANSEWVIEGYIDTSQVVWESEEAEQKKDFSAPFFPEGYGYLGRAHATYKFQATAITHRKDNPIYYAPLAHSFEYHFETFINDAALYDLLNKQRPGLVIDLNIPPSMLGTLGLVIQIKKERRRDESYIKNLILLAWASCPSLRIVIVVDEDVDIYSAEDIMWALSTRVNAKDNLILMPPGVSWAGQQGEEIGPSAPTWRMGFDATVPLEHKWQYFRGEFPSVNLENWFTKDQIAKVRASQSEYARFFAERRV